MRIGDLVPNANNARTHSPRQIAQIARSIERFGFNNPVLIDSNNQILAGHGRVAAAKLIGISKVPVLKIHHLSNVEKRAYVLAKSFGKFAATQPMVPSLQYSWTGDTWPKCWWQVKRPSSNLRICASGSSRTAAWDQLYRSRHELAFIWKCSRGKHNNNVELGQHGRSRTELLAFPHSRHDDQVDSIAQALTWMSQKRRTLRAAVIPIIVKVRNPYAEAFEYHY